MSQFSVKSLLLSLAIIHGLSAHSIGGVGESDNEEYIQKDLIIMMTNATFEKIVSRNEAVVVGFNVPLCDLCDDLDREFKLAAKISKARNKSIRFGSIDAEEHDQIAKKYNIDIYPSILFFIQGIPIQYQGKNEADKLLSWTSERLDAFPLDMSHEDMDKILNLTGLSLIFIGQGGKEFEIYRSYTKIAPETQTIFINASTADTNTITDYLNPGQSWSLLLLRNPNGFLKKFSELTLSLSAIQVFVESSRFPLIGNFMGVETLERIFYREGSSVVYLTDGVKDQFLRTFKSVARINQGRLNFFICRPKDKYSTEFKDFLPIIPKDERQIWLVHNINNEIDVYKFSSQFTPGRFRAFLKRFFSGHMIPGMLNVVESSIVWDMADPDIYLQLEKSNSIRVILNYNRNQCKKMIECWLKVKKFKRFASLLHFVPELEFGLLDLHRGYRLTKGDFYKYFKSSMPVITVKSSILDTPVALPYFDWTFKSFKGWVSRNFPQKKEK